MGIALVGEPRVMFLDEPTSGLDSYTGGEVMQVIKVQMRCARTHILPYVPLQRLTLPRIIDGLCHLKRAVRSALPSAAVCLLRAWLPA